MCVNFMTPGQYLQGQMRSNGGEFAIAGIKSELALVNS